MHKWLRASVCVIGICCGVCGARFGRFTVSLTGPLDRLDRKVEGAGLCDRELPSSCAKGGEEWRQRAPLRYSTEVVLLRHGDVRSGTTVHKEYPYQTSIVLQHFVEDQGQAGLVHQLVDVQGFQQSLSTIRATFASSFRIRCGSTSSCTWTTATPLTRTPPLPKPSCKR